MVPEMVKNHPVEEIAPARAETDPPVEKIAHTRAGTHLPVEKIAPARAGTDLPYFFEVPSPRACGGG